MYTRTGSNEFKTMKSRSEIPARNITLCQNDKPMPFSRYYKFPSGDIEQQQQMLTTTD
ncbi:MAG: hypothetical protein GY927_03665 [bacterium]|nr:hypothetical protein [bacterium]